MLRSFRVANHKSFRDEAELLFLPAYDKSRPVTPVAAIFGANASGKSNLLDALRWMRAAVRESYARWEPGAAVPRTPFRLDPAVSAAPSVYCVEIIIDESRYTYGLEVDDLRVIGEWLYTYPRNRRRVIFEREHDQIRLGSTVPDHRARGELLGRQTRDNALFLSVAAHNDLTQVQPMYGWLRNDVAFGSYDDEAAEETLTRLLSGERRDQIVALVQAADLGIADVAVQAFLTLSPDVLEKLIADREAGEVRDSVSKISRAIAIPVEQHVLFQHGDRGGFLSFGEQSAGTKSWANLVVHALNSLERGGLLVVDEVDSSLHPHLTARLVNLFRDPETNPVGAQLLLTTHDATLLDEDTLSRDEVWFVEKEPDSGATRLFPLTDFHPRKNENTEGRYLAGSYGAIPVLSEYRFRRAMRTGRVRDAAA